MEADLDLRRGAPREQQGRRQSRGNDAFLHDIPLNPLTPSAGSKPEAAGRPFDLPTFRAIAGTVSFLRTRRQTADAPSSPEDGGARTPAWPETSPSAHHRPGARAGQSDQARVGPSARRRPASARAARNAASNCRGHRAGRDEQRCRRRLGVHYEPHLCRQVRGMSRQKSEGIGIERRHLGFALDDGGQGAHRREARL